MQLLSRKCVAPVVIYNWKKQFNIYNRRDIYYLYQKVFKMFIPPYTHSNKINSTGFRCLLLVLLLSITMGACRKEVTTERVTSYYGRSYSEIFEAFWNGMNTNYIFWDIEKVNWNNMYTTYKSRFESLDQEKGDPYKTAQKAVQYLVDMTKDLADSHLSLHLMVLPIMLLRVILFNRIISIQQVSVNN